MSAHVPSSFESYLLLEGAEEMPGPARCDGCYREDQRCWLSGGPNRMVTCEICLRQFHADDRAEERMLSALLGAAVKGALAHEITAARVRAIVDEAIDEATARAMSAQASALMRGRAA